MWAVTQIDVATTEPEIRAALRVLKRVGGSHELAAAFILKVRRRLLEVGVTPLDTSH
jgi:hypothetical protein